MKTNGMLNTNWEDIIFKHRNKKYGAYRLRQDYNKNMSFAMGLCISLVFLFSLSIRDGKMNIEEYTSQEKEIIFEPNILTDIEPIYSQPIIDKANSKAPKLKSTDFFRVVKELPVEKTTEAPKEPSSNEGDNLNKGDTPTSDGLGDTGTNTDSISGGNNVGKGDVEFPDKVLNIADVMPVFGNSENDLKAYLLKNLKYPALAIENGTTGKVVLSFIIDSKGKVKDIKVIRGIADGCTEEAIRVVKNMPAWKPGVYMGKPVSVQFGLPVVFNLIK